MTTVLAETAVVRGGEIGSAVSWGAIAGGAVAAAGFSLVLLHFGTGLGLSAVSPWANSGASATTISVGAGISLILVSVMASALGGYLAGRLRTKWAGIHTDEAYLRDTAHGLMAWAFATVIGAALLAAAATSIVGGVGQGAAANPGLVPDKNSYYVDSLFRSTNTTAPANQAASTAEAGRIFARAVTPGGSLSSNDQTYLAQLVAARTGLSQADAEKRVSEVTAQAKAAADEARKAAAKLAFWMAAALLAGALASSVAAAVGGAERDA